MAATGENQTLESIRAFYDHARRNMKAGDLDTAESICRRAQAIYPRDPNILCLLGEILLKQRKPQEAQSWFGRTLKHHPAYPRALEGTGKALLAEKKPVKAVEFLQRAARAVPERVTTQLALARALAMSGQGPEADEMVKRALELDPDRALVSQAAEAFFEDRIPEAEKMLRDHLAQRPDNAVAIRLLGQIAMESNRPRPAYKLLKRSVELAPDFTHAWNDLANLHMKEERFNEALETVRTAIDLDPDLPHSRVIMGNILSKSQRHEEALVAYDEALALVPGHAGALSGKGHVLKTIGRTDESIAVYRECIHGHPAFGEAYWSLANLKTFKFSPEEVDTMENMVKREELAHEPKVNFFFSLGKQYDNEKDFDKAFDFYRRGAKLRRGHEIYDPVQTQVIHDRIIDVFSAQFLAQREGWGDPSPDPILIVGLPRSGSTLIEQILASHSQVEGTMELPDLSRCIREVNRARKDRVEYPMAVRDLSAADIQALGKRYMQTTAVYRTDKAYFIDKMPNNFTNLGFLHLILPNAKVINARRHPLDSCLGSFKQLFFKGQSFTYDFFELGQYYLQYQRIMDHWHEVLPGQVLDVRYEDVVRDQEGQTRRILEYCGLSFEEQTLRFYETDRAINTASSEQVRQPIYSGALNFWRNYEHLLGELIDELEPLLVQLPEEDQPAALRGR